MGKRDRRADGTSQSRAWHVYRDGGDIVAQDGHGADIRAALAGARSVRIVPLTGGNQHAHLRSGWQVALARPDGDVLVGKPMSDWRLARDLAQLVCEQAELPLDELTQKMFSRVGQYSPAPDA